MGAVTEVAPEGTSTAMTDGESAGGESAGGASKVGRAVGGTNVGKELVLRRGSKLPERAHAGFVHNTELDQALSRIKNDPTNHGVPFELFVYDKDTRARTSAAAKASDLRKRYTKGEGWAFVVGDSEAEPERTALWVQYGASGS